MKLRCDHCSCNRDLSNYKFYPEKKNAMSKSPISSVFPQFKLTSFHAIIYAPQKSAGGYLIG